MSARPRALACAGALGVSLVVLLARVVPAWPEDWDGVGFLLAVKTFSLERFTPHPPGYPVYVATLRAVAALGATPLLAAEIVSVGAGLGAVVLAFRASRSPRASLLLAAAVIGTPLALRSFTTVGTEGLATLLLLLALHAYYLQTAPNAPQRRAWPVGVAAGLGLGVRLSWAPLYLGLFVLALVSRPRETSEPEGATRRRESARAILAFTAAVLAWAVPLTILTGPERLVSLYAAHLGGHATRWGGTALTEPTRARYFLRDVLVDGLGVGPDALGVAIALVALVLAVRGVAHWIRRGAPARGPLAVLALYAAWIAVGQNLREEPRHALPLVVALASGLVLAGFVRSGGPLTALGPYLAWGFVGLTSLRAVTDASERRAIPPAAAQLVELTRHDPDVLVFGGRSARFFDQDGAGGAGRSAATLGDVVLALGRERRLPARVLVTDELTGRASSPYPLVPVATLCRPERLDRRRPCLEVDELRAPFLPH